MYPWLSVADLIYAKILISHTHINVCVYRWTSADVEVEQLEFNNWVTSLEKRDDIFTNTKSYKYLQDLTTFSWNLNFQFLNKIWQVMPLLFAAAEVASDFAREIKSGHSAKMKALLDIPMEKVEYWKLRQIW